MLCISYPRKGKVPLVQIAKWSKLVRKKKIGFFKFLNEKVEICSFSDPSVYLVSIFILTLSNLHLSK